MAKMVVGMTSVEAAVPEAAVSEAAVAAVAEDKAVQVIRGATGSRQLIRAGLADALGR
jgi:hypothetical protein